MKLHYVLNALSASEIFEICSSVPMVSQSRIFLNQKRSHRDLEACSQVTSRPPPNSRRSATIPVLKAHPNLELAPRFGLGPSKISLKSGYATVLNCLWSQRQRRLHWRTITVPIVCDRTFATFQ